MSEHGRKIISLSAAAMTLCLWSMTQAQAQIQSRTQLQGKRVDPTRPPGITRPKATPRKTTRQSKKKHHWRLSATLIAAHRRSAIINNELVQVGDPIHGARVIAIETNRVRLRHRGRTINLPLIPHDIKRPVPSHPIHSRHDATKKVTSP